MGAMTMVPGNQPNSLQALQRQQAFEGQTLQGGLNNWIPNGQQLAAGHELAMRANPARLHNAGNLALAARQIGLMDTARMQQPQNGSANFPQIPTVKGNNGPVPFQGNAPPGTYAAAKPGDAQNVPQGQMPNQISVEARQQAFQKKVLEFFRSPDGRDLSFEESRARMITFKSELEIERASMMRSKATMEPGLLHRNQTVIQTKDFIYSHVEQVMKRKIMEARAQAQLQNNASNGPSGAPPGARYYFT